MKFFNFNESELSSLGELALAEIIKGGFLDYGQLEFPSLCSTAPS